VPDLVAVQLSLVVLVIKIEPVRIVIQCFVTADPFSFYLKNTVMVLQLAHNVAELVDVKNEFSIGAVHQLHTVHLFKVYWLELLQYLRMCIHLSI
jgi:hypothetical protein